VHVEPLVLQLGLLEATEQAAKGAGRAARRLASAHRHQALGQGLAARLATRAQ
jgi:hypothetical protein